MSSKKPDLWMPVYIGDYLVDTSHLSRAQHGSYLLMMFHAWMHAGILPDDDEQLARIARSSPDEWARDRSTLLAFWTPCAGGYRQKRLDGELVKAQANLDQKSVAGKASAAKRWGDKSNERGNGKVTDVTTGEVTAKVTDAQRQNAPSPSPSPIPTAEPKSIGANAPVPVAKANGHHADLPACPHEKIIALYHELCPTLPTVKIWRGRRQDYARARWRENCERLKLGTEADGVEWFRTVFTAIAQSDFLMGRGHAMPGRRPFQADLEWILRPENFAKIIEGKYQ